MMPGVRSNPLITKDKSEQLNYIVQIERKEKMELTILMPCLNEAETLEICIKKAQTFLTENNVDGEILIADNGSTDGSQEIAARMGARVINVENKGYGAALIGGCNAAQGQYVIMIVMIFFI